MVEHICPNPLLDLHFSDAISRQKMVVPYLLNNNLLIEAHVEVVHTLIPKNKKRRWTFSLMNCGQLVDRWCNDTPFWATQWYILIFLRSDAVLLEVQTPLLFSEKGLIIIMTCWWPFLTSGNYLDISNETKAILLMQGKVISYVCSWASCNFGHMTGILWRLYICPQTCRANWRNFSCSHMIEAPLGIS